MEPSIWGNRMRTSKLSVLIMVFLGVTANAFAGSANWSNVDVETPLPISRNSGAGGDSLTGVASDGYYGLLFGWMASDGNMFAQHLNPVGTQMWNTESVIAENGICMAKTSLSILDGAAIAVGGDGVGGGYTAWVDDIDDIGGGEQTIYAAYLRNSGTSVDIDGTVEVTKALITGTATVALGVVTGTGTLFDTELRAGELVSFDNGGTWHTVDTVTSDTSATLTDLSVDVAAGPTIYTIPSYGTVGSIVRGANTAFLSELKKGDFIQFNGAGSWYKIASVESNTQARLLIQNVAAATLSSAKTTTTPTGIIPNLTFTADSKDVTTLGSFLNVIEAGDFIRLDSDGIWVRVESVNTTTYQTLTLDTAYPTNATGGTGAATLQRAIKFKVKLSNDTDICHSPHVLGTEGGVFVTWLNDTKGITVGGGDVVPLMEIAFITTGGTIQWQTALGAVHPEHTGYIAGADRDHSVRMLSDENGGVIVVWNAPTYVDENNPLQPVGSTWAARFDAVGNALWGEAPVLLFRRGEDAFHSSLKSVATVDSDGMGGLWVGGRWYYPNLSSWWWWGFDHGNFAIINHLSSEGDWKWDEWTPTLEWDSYEKGLYDFATPNTIPYQTNQHTPRVASDGAGGVYQIAKDDRMTEASSGLIGLTMQTADPDPDVTGDEYTYYTSDETETGIFTYGSRTVTISNNNNVVLEQGDWIGVNGRESSAGDGIFAQIETINSLTEVTLYSDWPLTNMTNVPIIVVNGATAKFAPNEDVFAQHVDGTGKRLWLDTNAGSWWVIDLDGNYTWYYYEWDEGYGLVKGLYKKQEVSLICEPWIRVDPVEGTVLYNPAVTVWADNSAGALDYDIRLSEVDEMYDEVYREWRPFSPWPGNILTVCDTSVSGATLATGARLHTVGNERFGTYAAWSNGTSIYATHANYYTIYESGRAPAIGKGPDIFPPAAVTDFVAGAKYGYVQLTWNNPRSNPGGEKPLRDWHGTMIRRSRDDYPQTPTDGELIYSGTGETKDDYVDIEVGVPYYYSAFTYDTETSNPNYSYPVYANVTIEFADVQEFTAGGLNTEIQLDWAEPDGDDYAGLIILRSEVAYPDTSDRDDYLANTLGSDITFVVDLAEGLTTYVDTGLTNGTLYYYTAFSYKDVPVDYTDGVNASSVPMPPVQNLSATANTNLVSLSYSISDTTGVTDIVIRRSTIAAPASTTEGVAVDNIPVLAGPGTYTVIDDGLINDTAYFYSAFAHDGSGNYSLPTSATATPVDLTPPPAVTSFTASAALEINQVNLTWTYPSTSSTPDLKGVRILRMAGSDYATGPEDTSAVLVYEAYLEDGSVYVLGDVDATLLDLPTSFEDNNVNDAGEPIVNITAGTTYNYTIWLYDGESPPNYSPSTTDSATPVANFAPTLSVTSPATTWNTASLPWSSNEDVTGTISYGIDASAISAGTLVFNTASWSIASVAGSIDLIDLKPSVSYVYTIIVTDEGGATATASGNFTTADMSAALDSDGDLMLDSWEEPGISMSPTDDNDGDSLSNLWEYRVGSDPEVVDTDKDGISDYNEVQNGSNPAAESVNTPLTNTGDGCGAVPGTNATATIMLFVTLVMVYSRRRQLVKVRADR